MSGMEFARGHLFVPFTKVDRERRMVWGIAQSEDPDCQDDLLDYNASVRAFEKWTGCIREMHDDKKAVGRRIELQCDPKTKQIAVGAYISKGAEDTWQKCLDGTLNGYSIGGHPLQTGSIVKNGRRLRHVTDYVLDELSLVDTPANATCLITAIQKRGTDLVATNILGALRPKGTTMRKRAKVQSLVTFTKGLGADDELIVARQSDFTKGADGNFYVKRDASMAPFKKADLDADGYNDSSDDVAPDDSINGVSDQDMSDHAQNALNAHDDWHALGGDSECKCDRDDDAPPMNGPDDDQNGDDADGDGMGKNASRRRRRNALRKRQRVAVGITKNDVESMFTTLTASIDEKLTNLRGGDPAPRKDGILVKRDDAGADGGDDAQPLSKNSTALKDAYAKREAFLKKGTQGLSPQDRSERESLAREIGSLEIEQLQLTGAQAR